MFHRVNGTVKDATRIPLVQNYDRKLLLFFHSKYHHFIPNVLKRACFPVCFPTL